MIKPRAVLQTISADIEGIDKGLIAPATMVKDRTFEFRSTIDTISGGNFARTSQTNLLKNNQFLDKATGISQEFPKISTKLEQLNKRKCL